MKKSIAIIACAALLSGCSIFHSSKSAKQTDVRDSLNKVERHELSSDTGTVTVREMTNYTFLSPAFKATSKTVIAQNELFKKLVAGLVVLDTGMVKVSLHYDTILNTLLTDVDKRPEQGNAHHEKTTTQKKGKTKIIDSKVKTRVSEKKEVENKESKPDYGWIPWVIGIGSLSAVLFAIASFIQKKFYAKSNTDRSQA